MPDGVVFKLSYLSPNDRINEFEFDFNINEFDTSLISSRAIDFDISINTDLKTIKGVMNGKMDLFFRYKDKYYILDWKSNFLGFTLNGYSSENIAEAMSENNYHLQYLIYTLSARLFLKNRERDFCYEKHFGGIIYVFMRGVRINENTGLYITKPSEAVLNNLEELILRPSS